MTPQRAPSRHGKGTGVYSLTLATMHDANVPLLSPLSLPNPDTGGKTFREEDIREGGDGDVAAAAVCVLPHESPGEPAHRSGVFTHR